MTLRTNYVSHPRVRHSDYAVSAGTDIVPMDICRRIRGEADQLINITRLNLLPDQ